MAVPGDVLQIRELSPDTTSPRAEADLIDLLEAQAVADQLSISEVARRIGVDKGLWSRARRRIDRLGVDACAKIVAQYPHLREPAARYLTSSFHPDALALLEEAGRILRRAS